MRRLVRRRVYEDAVDEIRSAVSKEEAYVHAGAPSDKPVGDVL